MNTHIINIDHVYWNNLRRGSKSALFELYNTYYDDLYHYGVKISGDDTITRDVIQDLFYELWIKREKLSVVNSVRPYLLRMMRNVLLDQIKKERNYQNTDDFEKIGLDVQFSHEELLIASETIFENKSLIVEVLNALPPRQKEIVVLRFFQHCSYDEISAITGLNYQSLRNSLSRALKKMKNTLVCKSTK